MTRLGARERERHRCYYEMRGEPKAAQERESESTWNMNTKDRQTNCTHTMTRDRQQMDMGRCFVSFHFISVSFRFMLRELVFSSSCV